MKPAQRPIELSFRLALYLLKNRLTGRKRFPWLAREESESLTEASAEQAMEAIAPVSLPDWARSEAEGLVDFLARRQY